MNSTNYIHHDKDGVNLSLEVLLFREREYIIAYCPALDLAGYGRDADHARRDFEEVLEMTLDYMIKKRTLAADLRAHGWKVRKNRAVMPLTDDEMRESDLVKEILGGKEYQSYRKELNIPAMA
jgi:hypothetical protein